MKTKCYVAHTQRLLLYPTITREQEASAKLIHQASHLETACPILDCIEDIQECSGQVQIQCLVYEEDECSWEPVLQVKLDFHGLLEDYLHIS